MNKKGASAEKRAEAAGIVPRETIVFPSISPFLIDAAIAKVSAEKLSAGRASALVGLSVAQLIDLNAGDDHPVSV